MKKTLTLQKRCQVRLIRLLNYNHQNQYLEASHLLFGSSERHSSLDVLNCLTFLNIKTVDKCGDLSQYELIFSVCFVNQHTHTHTHTHTHIHTQTYTHTHTHTNMQMKSGTLHIYSRTLSSFYYVLQTPKGLTSISFSLISFIVLQYDFERSKILEKGCRGVNSP